MTQEDYVSFETAKLLKEKGFDECCNLHYHYNESFNKWFQTSEYIDSRFKKYYYPCPTLQMVMKWLRKEHNKIVIPGISLDDRTSGTINYYIVGIWYIPKNNGGAFCYTSPTPYGGYSSFEEACEAGIKYCLENLI